MLLLRWESVLVIDIAVQKALQTDSPLRLSPDRLRTWSRALEGV